MQRFPMIISLGAALPSALARRSKPPPPLNPQA